MGECISQLLGIQSAEPLSIKKSAAWWLQQRTREERVETIVRAVITPEFL
jgi:hypothetical protein